MEIPSIEIFSISSYTKNCSKKFTDHLNAIDTGYKLQKRETGSLSNNQFMNGILTWFDWNSSFRNLRIILSDLRFHSKFQFVKYVLQPIFFSLLSAQNEVNELLPVTAPASSISSHTQKKNI